MRGGKKYKRSKKKNTKTKSSVESNVCVNGKDYDIVDVEGDGNCLFRCFSYYLYKKEDLHFAIRQTCVNYTVEHWNEEAPILLNTCEEDEEEVYVDAESYRINMGSDRCMGTDYELGVFIRYLRIPATYFREYEDDEPASIRQVQVLDNDNVNRDARRLNILFTGKRRNGHWQILLEKCVDNDQQNEREFLPVDHWLDAGNKAIARKKESKPKAVKKTSSRRTSKKTRVRKSRLDEKNDGAQLVEDGNDNKECCNTDSDGEEERPKERRFEGASEDDECGSERKLGLLEFAWGTATFDFGEET